MLYMLNMNDIRSEITMFKKYVQNNLSQQLVHNHVPIKGLVDGCKYCERFGNVFEHGVISAASKENLFCKYLTYKNGIKT